MSDNDNSKDQETKKRVLGEEWLDWDGEQSKEDSRESWATFLLLSLAVLAILILIGFLFLYLVLPRFESFGTLWAAVITASILGIAGVLILWYLLVLFSLLMKKRYINVCLDSSNKLIYFLLPHVSRLASLFGISSDRLSHSFILLNNMLTGPPGENGMILVLLPRCLRKDLMDKLKVACELYPDVVYHIAPGGTVARKIIKKTGPRAIVAIACERDLLSGIVEISGRIPVIGIPNRRPEGPCRDTVIDLNELKAALDYFQTVRSK